MVWFASRYLLFSGSVGPQPTGPLLCSGLFVLPAGPRSEQRFLRGPAASRRLEKPLQFGVWHHPPTRAEANGPQLPRGDQALQGAGAHTEAAGRIGQRERERTLLMYTSLH